MIRTAALAFTISLGAVTYAPVVAAASPACGPVVTDAIIRKPPGNSPMMAGYFTIANTCTKKPLVLNEARSSRFGEISLHVTTVVGTQSRMRYLPSLTIAGADRAVFEPGGLHLMLSRPTAPIELGAKVPVRLSGPGWSKTVMFTVRGFD